MSASSSAAESERLRRDRADLKAYIKMARRALGELAPASLCGERLAQAKIQIAAVLVATEEAAETIMREAEAGLSGKGDPVDHFIQIIEACAFQDLTGQRIGKVVTTLQLIEDRLSRLEADLGERFGEEANGASDLSAVDAVLLQGPPLPGGGITQNDVDEILAIKLRPA